MAEREHIDLLTPAEVCAILRISRRTLYRYSHYYKGRPAILHQIAYRGKVVFRQSAVEQFLADREF